MAQHDYNIANQGFPAFRTDLNNALSAIQTTNSGTSRPTGAVAGQLWLDTTTATSPTLKYYDGADDISLATIDHSANTVNWLDSTVSVTGLTTTATGTVLTLSDSATTSTVNLIIDNDKEIRFREATANGTNYISLSAPASLSADVTYTLPVAPTANNQALISSTAGAMSFTPYSLPASDGTANQILKTDGSGVLSFATPSGGGFSGATTTSSAVDITLTNTSTQVQNITMTADDKAVILPDATTLTTKGTPILYIRNNGLKAFDIKLNSGFILATLTVSQSIELILIDNATTDGSWRNNFLGIDGYSTIGAKHSVGNFLYTPSTLIKSGTTGSTALTYTFSHNCSGNNGISASKISTSSAIVCYHNGTSNRDIYAVVVSYSGTTITVNSEVLLYNGSSTASTGSQILMLTATEGLLFVTRASNNVAVPFTISGTTITAGTASSTFGTGTGSANDKQLGNAIAMDSTIALIPDRNSTTTATWTLRTITHNGASAPTIGTASSAITTQYVYAPPSLAKIDSTNAFASYGVVTTGYAVARVITISGSSAPTLQTANTSNSTNIEFSNKAVRISATEFIVVHRYGSINYTVSGTSVTHVGASLWKFSKKAVIGNDFMTAVFPFNNGSYAILEGQYNILLSWNNALDNVQSENRPTILIAKKDGNFMEISGVASASKVFSHHSALLTASSYSFVELDTNILLGVTNDNFSQWGGSYYTSTSAIHASILKYVGA
jgi:hypothetical protein